jgi:hypothetical protein
LLDISTTTTVVLQGDLQLVAIRNIIPHDPTVQLHHHRKESADISTENDVVRGIEKGIKMRIGKSAGVEKRKEMVVGCLLQARLLPSHRLFP